MPYDYTPTGWYATFDPTQHPERHVQSPVEAWSPDGHALIVDQKRGMLVPATQVRGFKGVRRCSRIVGVLPSPDGWEVEYPPESDQPAHREPVIGWVVNDEGDANPIMPISGDGNASSQPQKGQTLKFKGVSPEFDVEDVLQPDGE